MCSEANYVLCWNMEMFIIVIDTCRNIKKDIEGATLRFFCEALAVDLGWACCTKNLFLLQLSVYDGGDGWSFQI